MYKNATVKRQRMSWIKKHQLNYMLFTGDTYKT